MNKRLYDIIYFHGLGSSLSLEKRKALELYGKVTAPTYDYRNPEVLEQIKKSFTCVDNSIIIGSSFGGYLTNLFSTRYNIPSLLFNPALAVQSIPGMATLSNEVASNNSNLGYFVIGKKDTVVDADSSLDYINKYINGLKEIVIEPDLEHQIPFEVFQKHLHLFFNRLAQIPLKI